MSQPSATKDRLALHLEATERALARAQARAQATAEAEAEAGGSTHDGAGSTVSHNTYRQRPIQPHAARSKIPVLADTRVAQIPREKVRERKQQLIAEAKAKADGTSSTQAHNSPSLTHNANIPTHPACGGPSFSQAPSQGSSTVHSFQGNLTPRMRSTELVGWRRRFPMEAAQPLPREAARLRSVETARSRSPEYDNRVLLLEHPRQEGRAQQLALLSRPRALVTHSRALVADPRALVNHAHQRPGADGSPGRLLVLVVRVQEPEGGESGDED